MTEKKITKNNSTRWSLALFNIIIRRRVNPEKATEPVSEKKVLASGNNTLLLRLHLQRTYFRRCSIAAPLSFADLSHLRLYLSRRTRERK